MKWPKLIKPIKQAPDMANDIEIVSTNVSRGMRLKCQHNVPKFRSVNVVQGSPNRAEQLHSNGHDIYESKPQKGVWKTYPHRT